ncbi:MAG: crossover junction endodeoxyribonuclease RuvC [Dehalococcoidia bacterium]|nr:crossover junction endodeoxyribonuclease RuvC [Dehalococcoidia bacterium]
MIVLGVDPGQRGAVALVSYTQRGPELLGASRVPTVPRKSGGVMVDARALHEMLAAWMSQHGRAAWCGYELVHAYPQQGVTSVFRFGQADGVIRAVVAILGLAVVEVSPQAWKRAYNLPRDKAASVAIAHARLGRRLTPDEAEAALIALYVAMRTRAPS